MKTEKETLDVDEDAQFRARGYLYSPGSVGLCF